MTTHTKRVAAVAISVALGFGGAAAIAGNALAAPTTTPKATESAKPSPTPKPTSSTSTKAPAGARTGSATASPSVNTKKELIKTEFRDTTGKDGTAPQYERLSSSDTTLTSFGTLYTQAGQPLPNRVVAVYDFTNNKRGAQLGAGTTDAQGKFRFDAKLPAGWSTKAGFNVELAFDDEAGVYGSASGVMKPIASTATPTASATPTKKPTSAPTKDTSGGLAKTGN